MTRKNVALTLMVLLLMSAGLLAYWLVNLAPASRLAKYNPLTTEPVAFPDDWPIEELTVPPSSTKHCIGGNVMGDNNQPYVFDSQKDVWMVGYFNQLSWSENVEFFDSLLENQTMGFHGEMPDELPAGIGYGKVNEHKVKHYVSGSKGIRVSLIYCKNSYGGYSIKQQKYSGYIPYEGYTLIVVKDDMFRSDSGNPPH